MKIYDLLLANRRLHLIAPSREYVFFQENEYRLSLVPDLLPFINPKEGFSLIQTSIIIEALIKYEELVSYFASNPAPDSIVSVKPLFIYKNVPIYCPLFSVSNNLLIANNLGSKLNLNHDAIDIFEIYNFALYESNLTSLVKVGEDKHTRAYYHYDFNTIYIINDQGRLDNRICLFDKHIEKPDYRNIIERIAPVMKAYYANDRMAFINALLYEKLISNYVFNKYLAYLKRKKIV